MSEFRIPGLHLKDHHFSLPLDYQNPKGQQIQVFAREVVAVEKAKQDLPWLLYLQGGPGFSGITPRGMNGWLKSALKEFRVLILDQRGTGLSQPFDFSIVDQFSGDQEIADYLSHFRADNIVRDAEQIRASLKVDQWTLLGQSYGGFCIYTYLSFFPDSVREAMLTGGIPPVKQDIKDIYRATHRRVLARNNEFFRRYPNDRKIAKAVVENLRDQTVKLPNGAVLTPERFQQVGLDLGLGGGMAGVHYLLETAFPDKRFKQPSYRFLQQVESWTSHYETNPFYAILHESIYCEGEASNWAAGTVKKEFSQFDALGNDPFHFTGEVIYPFMFDQYPQLKKLKGAAQILASKNDWSDLYDVDVLKKVKAPCAAVVYEHDIFVEREFSLEAASMVPSMRCWTTSEYEHNGLGVDPERIFDRLLGMNRGLI